MAISVFDLDYWVTEDNRKLYPEKGEMDENHLRNVIKHIQKPQIVERCLIMARERYVAVYVDGPGPTGDGACLAFDQESDQIFDRLYATPEEFIRKSLKQSRLWAALHNGLNAAVKLRNQAARVNSGVIFGLEELPKKKMPAFIEQCQRYQHRKQLEIEKAMAEEHQRYAIDPKEVGQ